MASYKIEWKASAKKELRKLPPDVIKRVVSAVEGLSDDPHPAGSRKLVGSQHTYRIRVGAYRIIYDVVSSILVVEVIKVAHRKDVYR